MLFVKNPETGKRVSWINPPEDWIIVEVPELRICDDCFWQAVKNQQSEIMEQCADIIGATQTARANRLSSAHIAVTCSQACSNATTAAADIQCTD